MTCLNRALMEGGVVVVLGGVKRVSVLFRRGLCALSADWVLTEFWHQLSMSIQTYQDDSSHLKPPSRVFGTNVPKYIHKTRIPKCTKSNTLSFSFFWFWLLIKPPCRITPRTPLLTPASWKIKLGSSKTLQDMFPHAFSWRCVQPN